ncbi:MAG: hypothetical protein V1804_03640 [Patescibacteria group bacterium]
MSQHIKTSVGVVIILIVAFTAGFFTWKAMDSRNIKLDLSVAKQPSQVCTQEAKQCPDGSYVSRTGTNCEFKACPETSVVGNDKDKHGCIGSAGYSWCEGKQKCLRTWEESCGNSETKDWKAYQNEKYGYKINYPSDFELDEKESSISATNEGSSAGQGGLVGITGQYNSDMISLSIDANGAYPVKCENTAVKEINVDLRPVEICRDDRLNMFYVAIPKNDIVQNSENTNDYIFISANGNLKKKQNTEKFFELVLSTFKLN